MRAGRISRPCRTSQYPRAPVRRAEHRLCNGGGVMSLPSTPSFRLDGKRALVTGAGRGIGLAAAAALADAGADVTLISRSGEEVDAGAAAIRAGGGSADAQACDVTDLDTFARLVANGDPYDV